MLRADQLHQFNENLIQLINEFLKQRDTTSESNIAILQSIKSSLLQIFINPNESKMRYAAAKELLQILETQLGKQDNESVLQVIKNYQSQIFKSAAAAPDNSPSKLSITKKLLADLEMQNVSLDSEATKEAINDYLFLNFSYVSIPDPTFTKKHRRNTSVPKLSLPTVAAELPEISPLVEVSESESPKKSPSTTTSSPRSFEESSSVTPPVSPKKPTNNHVSGESKKPTKKDTQLKSPKKSSSESLKKSTSNAAAAATKPKSPRKSPKRSPRITVSPSTSPRNQEQITAKRKLKFDDPESPRQATPRSEPSPREKKSPHDISPRSTESAPTPRNLPSPKGSHFLSWVMFDGEKQKLSELTKQIDTARETLEAFYEKIEKMNQLELTIPSFSGESINKVAYSQAYGNKKTLTDGITFGDIHQKLKYLNEAELLQLLEKLKSNIKKYMHKNKLSVPSFCVMIAWKDRLYCINTGKLIAHLGLQTSMNQQQKIIYELLQNKPLTIATTHGYHYKHFTSTLFHSASQRRSVKINVLNLITSPERRVIAVITKNQNVENILDEISHFTEMEMAKEITNLALNDQSKINISTLVLKLTNTDIETNKAKQIATYMGLFCGKHGRNLALAFSEILSQAINKALDNKISIDEPNNTKIDDDIPYRTRSFTI